MGIVGPAYAAAVLVVLIPRERPLPASSAAPGVLPSLTERRCLQYDR